MKVYVIGVGLGSVDTLTVGAQRAIAESQLLVGAPRLLVPFADGVAERVACVRTDDIVCALEDAAADGDVQTASVLFSGDIGFHSGAKLLYPRLGEGYEVVSIPGISTLSYFCAKLHTTWEDVHLVSLHGTRGDAAAEVRSHGRTFFITGGELRVQDVCAQLVDGGFGDVRVHAGERLSYPDERIVIGTAAQLVHERFENLSVMLVENPDATGEDA